MDDYMFIPVIDSVLEMNPTEFEMYALQILQDHIKGLSLIHIWRLRTGIQKSYMVEKWQKKDCVAVQ